MDFYTLKEKIDGLFLKLECNELALFQPSKTQSGPSRELSSASRTNTRISHRMEFSLRREKDSVLPPERLTPLHSSPVNHPKSLDLENRKSYCNHTYNHLPLLHKKLLSYLRHVITPSQRWYGLHRRLCICPRVILP